MKTEINIDYDKKCVRCHKPGATDGGLCMSCLAKGITKGDYDHILRKPQREKTRIEIRKVRVKESRIKLEWNVYIGKSCEPDEYALNCLEEARPAFYLAMAALAVHVAAICELPEKDAVNITVSGVSFSWTDGIMGATITGLKKLRASTAPLVLNTPHKPESPYSEGADESNLLPADTRTALYELMAEAEAYIRGERKYTQMDMFAEKEAVEV